MLTFPRLPHPTPLSTKTKNKQTKTKQKKKKKTIPSSKWTILTIITKEVTSGHEIESEARSYFGMGSFLVS